MQTPDDMETDHKDWDGCNNQRHNMRNCTHAQNMQNQKKRRGIYSSKFIGVTWHKQKGKWQASIRIEGKLKFLGLFNLETDAALAYNKAAKELHGEFTVLNPILIKIRL